MLFTFMIQTNRVSALVEKIEVQTIWTVVLALDEWEYLGQLQGDDKYARD